MTRALGLSLFVSGFLAAGYAVAALFFVRFWRDSRDRLFLFFAIAFGLLLLQRIWLAIAVVGNSVTAWHYLLRLGAFLVILVGIVDKNRAAGSGGSR